MVHRLPAAPRVDRVSYLCDLARGRRVLHVGFVDTGCQQMQLRSGAWLHAHLARTASSIVGIDLDAEGVAGARAAGYEATVLDCTDAAALDAAGLAPAQLLIAGEVIEHLDSPGALFENAHRLVQPGGLLVVTTPNAYGWLNVAASLVGREINHPDHVCMFTWRTLSNLASRHGWRVEQTTVYVPAVKPFGGSGLTARAMGGAAAAVCLAERVACAAGRPFSADGLIVAFRSCR
jgi:SAM-dependent methyltransferase